MSEVGGPKLGPMNIGKEAKPPCAVRDVAGVRPDLLVAEEGWKRGGRNPFLLGF